MATRRTPVRIRWWIFAFVFGFAFLSYLQRTSLPIVAKPLMDELGLSMLDIGWLNSAFVTAYALAQIPGAALGQVQGARRTYVFVGLVGLVAMLAVPLAPMLLAGTGVFVALVVAQALLGASQGPVFPMCAAVGEVWFPVNRWAFVNGVVSTGMNLGGVLATPLIVFLMAHFGWRGALLWLALPAALLTAGWAFYGRDTPAEHPSVTAEEIAELPPPAATRPPLTLRRLLAVGSERNVLLLATSYFCMNYAFYLLSTWSYQYLLQVRHLEGLEGGFAGAVPWLGAAAGAGIGGMVTDRLATRFGPRWGYRLLPLVTLPIAGLLLLLTTLVATPAAAVAALTVAFFAVECTEGPYWAATMSVARTDTAAATGVLNTGGNLAGMVTGPLVGWLAGIGGWNGAFLTGLGFAFAAAALWLLVDSDPRPTDPSAA
jgi:MFS transporter, ACS family, glucarate transporter